MFHTCVLAYLQVLFLIFLRDCLAYNKLCMGCNTDRATSIAAMSLECLTSTSLETQLSVVVETSPRDTGWKRTHSLQTESAPLATGDAPSQLRWGYIAVMAARCGGGQDRTSRGHEEPVYRLKRVAALQGGAAVRWSSYVRYCEKDIVILKDDNVWLVQLARDVAALTCFWHHKDCVVNFSTVHVFINLSENVFVDVVSILIVCMLASHYRGVVGDAVLHAVNCAAKGVCNTREAVVRLNLWEANDGLLVEARSIIAQIARLHLAKLTGKAFRVS